MHPLETWLSKQTDDDGRPMRRYQLAEMLHCAPSRVTQIIRDGDMPSPPLAARIKEIANISMDRLYSASEAIKKERKAERV